ncbi:MAG: EamA family transporter [Bryobacteraceae bacterium]
MTGPDSERRKIKTAAVTAVVVLSSVLGNYWLTLGMHQVGEPKAPLDYITSIFHPAVFAGVVLLSLWMLSHMALLSFADLSYVLPVTSVGYVLAALAGKWFLGEIISTTRWLGIALIMGGVILVGRTPPSTTGGRPPS